MKKIILLSLITLFAFDLTASNKEIIFEDEESAFTHFRSISRNEGDVFIVRAHTASQESVLEMLSSSGQDLDLSIVTFGVFAENYELGDNVRFLKFVHGKESCCII